MKCLACALLLLACVVVRAQNSPPASTASTGLSDRANFSTNSILLTGEWDHFLSAVDGGGGSIDWIRANENGRTYTAGVSAFSIAGSHWAFGKGGISLRPNERIILQAQASVGGGRTAGAGFTYQTYDGGLAYKALKRLYLDFDNEYLRIGETRGDLLKPGITFFPAQRVSTVFTYAHSAGGNLDTEYVSGRVDYSFPSVRVLGGFAVGQTAPEIFNVRVGSPAGTLNLREGFFGFGIPVSRTEVSVISDFLNLDATHKRTLSVSLKLPLHR